MFPASWCFGVTVQGNEMDENPSVDASADDQRPRRIVPEGRRFQRGVSACPGGRHGKMKRLRADHTAQLEAHLGRPLQPQEIEIVEQLVTVKMTKPTSTAETLRQAGLITRLMNTLYGDAKVAAKPALPAVSPAEAMAAYRATAGLR